MTQQIAHHVTRTPITRAMSDALAAVNDQCVAAELRHLESWQLGAVDDLAGLLRMRQLRRAHPALAAAVRAELERAR